VSVIDNSANQIVRGWNLIQEKKDTKSLLALHVGRNRQV
jgi:hypothetical protein